MDIVRTAVTAVEFHAVAGPWLCFAAGLLSSFGPCVAPRFIAVAGIGSGSARRVQRYGVLASLVCGLCVGYLGIGLAASAFVRVVSMPSVIYVVVAGLFLFAGARSIMSAGQEATCNCAAAPPSLGSGFVLGASFALVISPCCTPVVAAIAAVGQIYGDWTFAGICILAFALGHAVPLIAAAFASVLLRERLQRSAQAASVIGGALLLGLAGYYAVLV